MGYFIKVTTNSNKYRQDHINNGKSGGMEWIHITVQVMLYFYGVMLRISIDNRNLGGYTYYFKSISIICCGQGYTVSLEAYVGWDNKITSF